jgi:hypothetical protein
MDSDRLNRWLTLGANVGVLVGIILLVFELSQNREMMRAQTRNEISRVEMDLLGLTAANRELWEAEMDRAALVLSTPGVRQWWDAGGRTQLTPSFVKFLESIERQGTTWYWVDKLGFTSDGTF